MCRSSFNNVCIKKRASLLAVSAIIHDIGSNKKLWLSQHNIAPVVKQMLVVQLGLLKFLCGNKRMSPVSPLTLATYSSKGKLPPPALFVRPELDLRDFG